LRRKSRRPATAEQVSAISGLRLLPILSSKIVIGVILIIAVYLDRLRILQEAMFDRLRALCYA
jgi:hypothetical protein